MKTAIAVLLLALLHGSSPYWRHEAMPPAIELTWTPPQPIQGSIVHLTVRPDTLDPGPDVVAIKGVMARQALHFEPDGNGGFRALAGIPVNANDSIRLELTFVNRTGSSERSVRYLPVERGEFTTIQLSVDPRFVDPPDSALRVRIAAERDSVRRVTRLSHATPRMWSESFTLPRDSRLTSPFGQRREFNGEVRSLHLGTDLAGQVGAPVAATNRAVVALVGDFYYAGGLVYLDHGQGLMTAYLHLSDTFVAVGDTVERGEIIGSVGASGRVTGPHLHWTARYGDVPVSPLSLLDLETFSPY
ncbi:MAG: M23 family metallopeptidase [Gemmatimonadota bacterium]|nr:MAG: M23 family metallopeptidase [Gemmatimonadota bacterium]